MYFFELKKKIIVTRLLLYAINKRKINQEIAMAVMGIN